jgi:hypothetical protein
MINWMKGLHDLGYLTILMTGNQEIYKSGKSGFQTMRL